MAFGRGVAVGCALALAACGGKSNGSGGAAAVSQPDAGTDGGADAGTWTSPLGLSSVAFVGRISVIVGGVVSPGFGDGFVVRVGSSG